MRPTSNIANSREAKATHETLSTVVTRVCHLSSQKGRGWIKQNQQFKVTLVYIGISRPVSNSGSSWLLCPLSVLSTTASTGVGVGPKLLPRELPESKQRLAVMPPTPASLRLPSLVLVKEEISLLLVYNITEHVRKNNPGAHQDLNDCKIQSQVTWEHKGTMCGIHVSPEQQLLLPNLQGQARPKKGLMQK